MERYFYYEDGKFLEEILSILRSGGAIAGSSDTVFGLFSSLSKAGCDKLNAIKNRFDKPYLILIGDKQKAKQFTDAFDSRKLEKIIDRYWPGPLTIIVPAKKEIPDFMKSKSGGIALRVPDHKGLQAILKQVDGLFSTSANITGEPIPQSIDEMDPSIKESVDGIILDKTTKKKSVPSTIIDCTGDEIKVVREGAIELDFLRKENF